MDLRPDAIDALLSKVTYNSDGLVAAIAQDAENGDVLMMAWMNADTLRKTLETGRACYWSRSRQAFWRKGDTSGHHQTVHDLRIDCDGDTILMKISQVGAACHTGERTCFFTSVNDL
ncbi:phosphoribosyl-AMP cyclohydrolase [Alphaproteobacteria bacterium]|jgi:phosphoribosyl-AMP cyclohydrolase|nr:phosphoribosyl-AMP cyclohydrolase [Alphaproteobacteria bacterium]